MIIGTMNIPPQLRFGLAVLECWLVKNMHMVTKRSPRIFAYDVKASDSKMSPNLPSCASASPPMLIRRRVWRNRYLPAFDHCCKGIMNAITSRRRYNCGRISQARTDVTFPRVMAQNRRREKHKGIVIMNASRYTRLW